MSRQIRISFFIVLALSILAFFLLRAETAAAQVTVDPLEVTFAPDPLFGEENFLPGDGASGTITARNNTDSSHDVYIRFIEHSQIRDLAETISISISDGGTEIREQMLSEWFRDRAVFLKNLSPDETAVFAISAMFEETAGDEYQNGTVDFDVCVGLSGGDAVCMSEEELVGRASSTGQSSPDSNSDPNAREAITSEPLSVLDPTLGGGAALATQNAGGSFEDAQGERAAEDETHPAEDGGEGNEDTEAGEEGEGGERETQAAAAVLGLSGGVSKTLLWISYGLLFTLAPTLLRTLLRRRR